MLIPLFVLQQHQDSRTQHKILLRHQKDPKEFLLGVPNATTGNYSGINTEITAIHEFSMSCLW